MSSENETIQMLPMKPYYLRMMWQYIVDNGLTPHILVITSFKDVEVPKANIENDTITLNISPSAVKYLNMGDEYISFEGRFNGVVQQCMIPVEAVAFIVAKETNEVGIQFEVYFPQEEVGQKTENILKHAETHPEAPKRDRSHLRVVK